MRPSLLIILLLMVVTLPAQQLAFRGRVTGNDRPAEAAGIWVRGVKQRLVADSTGGFVVKDIAAHAVHLKISAVGFQLMDTVVVWKGDTSLHLFVMKPLDMVNEEVVISGTLKPVSKTASPIVVEVFTPAYFRKNPTPNIFEGLQQVNGVQPQLNCNVCNTGDIHINGMEGPYTMVLIDGMPIVSSLATVYGLSGIPNSIIKRLEVVKGPASTLYGSEAVGGLINVITKDPSSAGKIQADISATSVREYNADISSSFSLGRLTGLLGISYFNYNNRRDINQDNFTDIALQQRISVFNKWNVKFSKRIKSDLALRYVYENRWGGQLQWQEENRGSNKVYGEFILTNRIELISSTSLGNHLQADISWNQHRQRSWYGTVKYFGNQQVLFAQVRWQQKKGNHDLLAGLPLRYTFYDDNTPATIGSGNQNQPDRTFLPGVFVQDEIKLSDQLIMLAGIRYDHHNRHGNIFTPRLSFKYDVRNKSVTRVSVGNGYRVVNLFTEDHAALTGARDVVIKSTLKPERSWNCNINQTWLVKGERGLASFDITAFATYFSNKIVADYFTDPQKIIYDNLDGYAVSCGISVNADINYANGLKLMAGCTFMKVYQVVFTDERKKVKTPQLFAPEFSGILAVSYHFPGRRFTIDLTGRINGPMLLPVVPGDFRSEKSPLYGILNLQLTHSLKSGIEFYAGIKNLLGFIPKHPLLHPDDPFNTPGGKYFDINGNPRTDTNPNGYYFDPSYNYASVQGAKIFFGTRFTLP